MKILTTISLLIILTLLPTPSFAEESHVGGLIPESEYVFALNGVVEDCEVEVRSWDTLVSAWGSLDKFNLSHVTITMPRGEGSCFYRYSISHPYLDSYFTSNTPTTCLWYNSPQYKIECFTNIVKAKVTLSFYTSGTSEEITGTTAENWTFNEYFTWLVRGWRVFIPSVLG